MKKEIELVTADGLRSDGRKFDELRPVKIEVGVVKNAEGSAYIEQGKNKIMVAVYGPREVHPKHLTLPDRALIRCRYSMTTFSVEERKSPAPSRREIELSKVIREALEPATFLEQYPRTTIDIFIKILEADGGTRGCSISAASAALADAGIPMRDLVTSVAVGKVDGRLALDLNGLEDMHGQGDMPIAMMLNLELVTLLQADGSFSPKEIEEGFELAMKGLREIRDVQMKAIRDKYLEIAKMVREDV